MNFSNNTHKKASSLILEGNIQEGLDVLFEGVKEYDPGCMTDLGEILVFGDHGKPPDPENGWMLIDEAAKLGWPSAVRLKGSYIMQHGDIHVALCVIKKAAFMGERDAMTTLSAIHYKLGNKIQSFAWAKVSMEKGCSMARIKYEAFNSRFALNFIIKKQVRKLAESINAQLSIVENEKQSDRQRYFNHIEILSNNHNY